MQELEGWWGECPHTRHSPSQDGREPTAAASDAPSAGQASGQTAVLESQPRWRLRRNRQLPAAQGMGSGVRLRPSSTKLAALALLLPGSGKLPDAWDTQYPRSQTREHRPEEVRFPGLPGSPSQPRP